MRKKRMQKRDLGGGLRYEFDTVAKRGRVRIDGKWLSLWGDRLLARDLWLDENELADISKVHEEVTGLPLRPTLVQAMFRAVEAMAHELNKV